MPTDDFVWGKCAAEEKCYEMGAILAPFTEKSEFDAVMQALLSCEYQQPLGGFPMYIGLNIAKDNSSRIFSNGVPFDYDVHGHLYEEDYVNMPKDCPYATLFPLRKEKLHILPNFNCDTPFIPYICFKTKKTARSFFLVARDSVNSGWIDSAGPIFMFSVFCLVCFMAKKIRNLQLKLQRCSELA